MGMDPLATSENVPGVMQKNVAWLKAQTEYLKAQREFVAEVNKSKPETWKSMTESTAELVSLADRGGLSILIQAPMQRVMDNLSLEFEKILVPVVNLINDVLGPIIDKLGPILQDFIDDIGPLISEMGKVGGDLLGFSIEWTSPIGVFNKILEILEKIAGLFGAGLTAAEKAALEEFMEEIIARFGGEEQVAGGYY